MDSPHLSFLPPLSCQAACHGLLLPWQPSQAQAWSQRPSSSIPHPRVPMQGGVSSIAGFKEGEEGRAEGGIKPLWLQEGSGLGWGWRRQPTQPYPLPTPRTSNSKQTTGDKWGAAVRERLRRPGEACSQEEKEVRSPWQ